MSQSNHPIQTTTNHIPHSTENQHPESELDNMLDSHHDQTDLNQPITSKIKDTVIGSIETAKETITENIVHTIEDLTEAVKHSLVVSAEATKEALAANVEYVKDAVYGAKEMVLGKSEEDPKKLEPETETQEGIETVCNMAKNLHENTPEEKQFNESIEKIREMTQENQKETREKTSAQIIEENLKLDKDKVYEDHPVDKADKLIDFLQGHNEGSMQEAN